MRTYLPAAGHPAALVFYDPLTRLLGYGAARLALLSQAGIAPGHRVLDLGCGTGSLAVELKRRDPEVEVVGLDPDPDALARARRKAERARVAVRFDEGFGDALPYDDRSFDRVLSSFMLHHLGPDVKVRTLREVRRVLAPTGSLHLLDFEVRDGSGIARHLPWNRHAAGNTEAAILALFREAGFARASRVESRAGWLAQLGYYRASAATDAGAAA